MSVTEWQTPTEAPDVDGFAITELDEGEIMDQVGMAAQEASRAVRQHFASMVARPDRLRFEIEVAKQYSADLADEWEQHWQA